MQGDPMDLCVNPECGSEIPFSSDGCPTCGTGVAKPNVRDALRQKAKLQERHAAARSKAAASGNEDVFTAFENEVGKNSKAVITVTLGYLLEFLSDPKQLYSAYDQLVRAKIRLPAEPDDDANRKNVESWLFNGYEDKVRYAALSLDGHGPSSYGRISEPICAMILANFAIKGRATVLEENSYHFVARHKISKPSDVPPGHMAQWEDRGKLAATKLNDKLSVTTGAEDFPNILLTSQGDRKTDDFLEVIIYDGFGSRAVESVRQLTKSSPADTARLKEKLSEVGKAWHPL